VIVRCGLCKYSGSAHVDDVLLVPAHSTVLPRDVEMKTQLTRGITLHIPLVAAAMDTVTEARLAIAIAQEGGIGIIHKNMTVEQQAREVRHVKKYESGVIKDPITVSPDVSIRDVIKLTRAKIFQVFLWLMATNWSALLPVVICDLRRALMNPFQKL